jgi:hypothetical protein
VRILKGTLGDALHAVMCGAGAQPAPDIGRAAALWRPIRPSLAALIAMLIGVPIEHRPACS